ncbi:olfactory receptor 14A16-like [Rhineura floridana]|uniref:olfactory receptor 14A16-like n=1 Tax=Rhineura floridana TaxID=261503 RepID=UPI002AC872C9|nr:olfactory receptor 14A16-like [Rhineura floridana]
MQSTLKKLKRKEEITFGNVLSMKKKTSECSAVCLESLNEDKAGSTSVMNENVDNKSYVSEFLLLEFSAIRELQILHFLLFLGLYLMIVSGNLLIISAVAIDHHLHTPMYFFLMNLAIQDIGTASVFILKSMVNSLMNTRHISYAGCVVQVFAYVFFAGSDFFLLTVMAYDRYVAICNPLQYEMVMNRTACIQRVAAVWVAGFLYAVLHTGGTFTTPFCSNVINQFFCEIPQLLTLACSNLYLETGVVVMSVILVFSCFVYIVVTYVHIFSAVLKIPSIQARKKAFSTCLPHLIVFSILCFTASFAYLRPPSNTPSHLDFVLTVMYTIVPPMFNPIIYSMRNKDIKNALSKLLGLRHSSGSFATSTARLDALETPTDTSQIVSEGPAATLTAAAAAGTISPAASDSQAPCAPGPLTGAGTMATDMGARRSSQGSDLSGILPNSCGSPFVGWGVEELYRPLLVR